MPKLKYHLLRYYLLLSFIPDNFESNKKPNDDCIEITGLDFQLFCRLIEGMVLYNIQVSPLLNDKDLLIIADKINKEHKNHTLENLIKVRNYFVGNYGFYRDVQLIHNPFIFKPIIKTKTNNYIVSGIHIWFQKIIEGVYWIIRDFYFKKGSEYFLERFGYYFEEYVNLLFEFYLQKYNYLKIPVEQKDGIKRADWFVFTNKYLLIIEQKSSLLPIKYKEENLDLKGLENFFLKTFKRGIEQLYKTEMDCKDEKRIIIKLLLHFEYLNFGEGIVKEYLKDICLKRNIFKAEVFQNLFFIEIDEFESLIQIISEDEEIFNKIIEKKIETNGIKNFQVGKEFHLTIQEYYDKKEIAFLEDKFREYEAFIKINN
jgi:hypothetical protein